MSASKRLYVGSIATETNSFSPLRTDIQDFYDSFYARSGEHPSTPTLCSAIFPVARERAKKLDWTLIEGTAAWAEPGGLVNQPTWETLRDQLLAELQAAMPVDIVLLGLHGAMISQECLDCEGDLLEAIRAIVGEDAIIGATFDPHSHLSEKRVRNLDLITVFKEFPHTDFVQAAENLFSLAGQTAANQVTPRISVYDCRMIEILPTSREPMRSFVDKIKSLEGQGSILSISIIHGFMAGDVPDLGTKVVVVTDDDQQGGDTLAAQLGAELFEMRGKTRPQFLTVDDALAKLNLVTKSPTVIADVWDNPGGGVPGDSTVILASMLAANLKNAALATIWDPIAVRTCFSAGEGAEFQLRFGGKMSDQGGEPLDKVILVKRLVRDATQTFGESVVPLGDSACIEINGIEVILNTVRSQVFNPDVFSNLGIDPTLKDVLVVKSTNHFHDAFARISDNILYAAVDGPYPNRPETNPYRNLKRAIWPRVEKPHAIEH